MPEKTTSNLTKLHYFSEDVNSIPLPNKFTFPFYYEPHPLAKIAAEELQDYLKNQTDFEHNFGLEEHSKLPVIGKMFGVLVVKNADGQLGYLRAFSGKLAGKNEHTGFVPPVFDMLKKGSFFLLEEESINAMNRRIEELETDKSFTELKEKIAFKENAYTHEMEELRNKIKVSRAQRKEKRIYAKENLCAEDFEALIVTLGNESIEEKIAFKKRSNELLRELNSLKTDLTERAEVISNLKTQRSRMSAVLQRKLFEQYWFLNGRNEKKNLQSIFEKSVAGKPPAGAGECAAPKLLHFAFQNNLEPIAISEFWWGESPPGEIRTHGNYYPACQGKCGPILNFMLEGLNVEENPFLINHAAGKELEILFEDDWIIVLSKPAEFLSVPGKTITDSVLVRLRKMYPDTTGPLLVHRLDMSTSGLMIAAKDKDTHKKLQRQFIKRKVIKRYTALIDGHIRNQSGIIDLPLRVDLDDRPRQMVCFEHGKSARTKWEVVAYEGNRTRIHFYPITGRTHQLRVHAAHPKGLNSPIVGDDLYGRKENRLHLHATFISFEHPASRETLRFEQAAEF
ncbi:MAG: pseudouridine synthase [Brumimicrobium sp.]|nr:pseudouridine synthase [Brumimicrobium sp.]